MPEYEVVISLTFAIPVAAENEDLAERRVWDDQLLDAKFRDGSYATEVVSVEEIS